MTVFFMDSFDHYTTVSQKYDLYYAENGSAQNVISGGRFGNGLRISGATIGAQDNYFGITIPTSYTTIVAGFAMRWNGLQSDRLIFGLYETATRHTSIYMNSLRQLYIARGATNVATGPTILVAGVWYYVELKTTIADTNGFAELRINGVTEATYSGAAADTRNAGAGLGINRIYFFGSTGSGGGNYLDRDDVVLQGDNVGAIDYFGDVRVSSLFPNGVGNSTQFVRGGTDTGANWSQVNETPPNSGQYVQAAAIGNKDTYTFGNVSAATGLVYGVQIMPWLAKTDAGVRNAASVARLTGVEEDSADKVLSLTGRYMPDIRETRPGGGAWTIDDINNAEFGVKVTA